MGWRAVAARFLCRWPRARLALLHQDTVPRRSLSAQTRCSRYRSADRHESGDTKNTPSISCSATLLRGAEFACYFFPAQHSQPSGPTVADEALKSGRLGCIRYISPGPDDSRGDQRLPHLPTPPTRPPGLPRARLELLDPTHPVRTTKHNRRDRRRLERRGCRTGSRRSAPRKSRRRCTFGAPPLSSRRERPAALEAAYGFVPPCSSARSGGPHQRAHQTSSARAAGREHHRRQSQRPSTRAASGPSDSASGGNVVPCRLLQVLAGGGFPTFAATINRVTKLLTLSDSAAERLSRHLHEDPAAVPSSSWPPRLAPLSTG